MGSLLVFDPAKAGAAGSGGSVAPGDAVVGIVTERGAKGFSVSFFFRVLPSLLFIPYRRDLGLPQPELNLASRCRVKKIYDPVWLDRKKRPGKGPSAEERAL